MCFRPVLPSSLQSSCLDIDWSASVLCVSLPHFPAFIATDILHVQQQPKHSMVSLWASRNCWTTVCTNPDYWLCWLGSRGVGVQTQHLQGQTFPAPNTLPTHSEVQVPRRINKPLVKGDIDILKIKVNQVGKTRLHSVHRAATLCFQCIFLRKQPCNSKEAAENKNLGMDR